MADVRDVAVLVASLRKDSLTRKIVLAMKGVAPPALRLLVYVNVLAMAQPEAYVSLAGELVDADYRITKEETRKFFETFLDAFSAWIERTRASGE